MIEFEALMRAIHKSVKDAAKSVEGETVDFINRFFEETTDDESKSDNHSVMRPKTCTMQFPSRTADGIETVTAEVPLLALVPISSPRIMEVKFTTELDITTNKDEKLLVSFPKPRKRSFFSSNDSSDGAPSGNATIEITLTGDEPPEGLKTLIDGYERALRAQIPG
ncbi:DUF2589 domain-containing protein [Marinomonas mediterranea]|jgi:Protein of unknown function (DUF2589).|uniref:DUF2589 domain-containing protein n=1 Tax=Marinomonas mediterranea (strain ATCC 700492 / JCM 21426 / NBRC 103028 / MMB-1) TaxID=717774 RepID=F2JXI7_MARM1|nr:DUF2589 domain-containing protein [Marinomonas mediterranea]ADZ91887.1 hypothetical protein Marme_2656 [Marinomonas mediterranea MMB-1]WCN17977.1 DUF2589 domain-containing protein [Marinomonas mediterranea MMB-1]